MASNKPIQTVKITTHNKNARLQQFASNAETASEWETEDHAVSGFSAPQGTNAALQPNRAGGVSAMGRMGSNRMVVSSSIHRDSVVGANSAS